MYFHRLHISAWHTITFTRGRNPHLREPLYRRGIALDLLPLLKSVLNLAADPGLDTQQLNPAEHSWWSNTLVVRRNFRNVLTVEEMVCLE